MNMYMLLVDIYKTIVDHTERVEVKSYYVRRAVYLCNNCKSVTLLYSQRRVTRYL